MTWAAPLFCVLLQLTAGQRCDFEGKCDWHFATHPHSDKVEDNFHIVNGVEFGKTSDYAHYTLKELSPTVTQVPGIHSPWYQAYSDQCRLQFTYRLVGQADAAVVVAATTTANAQPFVIDSFPATNSHMDSWHNVSVPIRRKFRDLTQFSIECHPGHLHTSSPHTGYDDYSDGFSIDEFDLDMNMGRRHRRQVGNAFECSVDNIQLVDCELEHEGSCSGGAKFACAPSASTHTCIDLERVCDMVDDCPAGDDENDAMNNCTSVPDGARCTFDDPLLESCAGWTIDSVVVGRREGHKNRWVRVNGTSVNEYATLVDPSMRDHTSDTPGGGFMFASTGGSHSTNPLASMELLSPYFPPLSSRHFDVNDTLYHTCFMHFFYCIKGEFAPNLIVYRDVGGQRSKKHVWKSQRETVHRRDNHCQWRRASLPFHEPITKEYRLRFVAKLAFANEDYAVDDFSMSPSCFVGAFEWHSSYVSPLYNVTTCRVRGRDGPTDADCQSEYTQDDSQVKGVEVHVKDGVQRWTVPLTTEYRIVAMGAAGGHLPSLGASPLNKGARVDAIVNLTANASVDIAVGQMGQTACDAKDTMTSFNLNTVMAIAAACHSSANESIDRALTLPGTGGGGATIVRLNGQLIIVAGGGGGVFWSGSVDQPMALDGHPLSPIVSTTRSVHAGGRGLATDEERLPIGAMGVWPDDPWMTGGGGALAPCANVSKSLIAECLSFTRSPVSGQNLSVDLTGGQCTEQADKALMRLSGGFGGGGASCGPGGGGGGGYFGGRGGRNSHGEGGSSYSAGPSTMKEDFNGGQGRVLIVPCRLKCPHPSVCRFDKQNEQLCACENGMSFTDPLSGSCKNVKIHPTMPRISHDFLIALLVIVACLLLIICFGCSYTVYYYKYSGRAMGPQHSIPLRSFGADSLFTMGGQTEANPNYEMFSSLDDLVHISRDHLSLVKLLGQGAFGEVFEGKLKSEMHNGNMMTGSVIDPANDDVLVAVKLLPDSAKEQQMWEFDMEALIMSKFNHENIVRLIGVCFDKMPRYIVLELLAGGDLKNFLRENRPKVATRLPLAMIDLLCMSLDVARGARYLEDNHFIHRDIAARNCLLTTQNSGRTVKIADFGMARDIYRADYYKKGGRTMLPVKWMPPESFLDGEFSSKTDVWAYGVLLWEISSMGYMPYPGRNNHEVMQVVTAGGRLESPNGCPLAIYTLMKSCWATDAQDRPKFSSIVQSLLTLIGDADMAEMPLPPAIYEAALGQSSLLLMDPPHPLRREEECRTTQTLADVSRPNSLETGDRFAPELMPTRGTGVAESAAKPYQPLKTEPYLMPCGSPKPSAPSSEGEPAGISEPLLDRGIDTVVRTNETLPSDYAQSQIL